MELKTCNILGLDILVTPKESPDKQLNQCNIRFQKNQDIFK